MCYELNDKRIEKIFKDLKEFGNHDKNIPKKEKSILLNLPK
jgi:hypothetical protein